VIFDTPATVETSEMVAADIIHELVCFCKSKNFFTMCDLQWNKMYILASARATLTHKMPEKHFKIVETFQRKSIDHSRNLRVKQ